MDNLNSFEIDINRWAKPLNLYTDGVIKSIVRDVASALEKSNFNIEDSYRILPFGSQYFDSAISVNTPIDIYVLDIKNYYYDVESGIDTTALDLSEKKADYNKYREEVYKAIQTHFKKSNVSIIGNSILVKKEIYRINVIPVFSHRSYRNVIDKNGDNSISFIEGVILFNRDNVQTINYPYHDEKNYHSANIKTDYRFNSIIRLFKNMSNWISRKEGYSTMVHHFLISCLIYNVPNVILKRMSGYDDAINEILDYLYGVLTSDLYKDMYEINDIKLLFSSKQKWDIITARNFILKCRQYIKYII